MMMMIDKNDKQSTTHHPVFPHPVFPFYLQLSYKHRPGWRNISYCQRMKSLELFHPKQFQKR